MKVHGLRLLAAALLLASALPAAGQNVRYEQQGTAYVTAEDQWIADRLVDQVIGVPQDTGAQVVFYRTRDQVPGAISLDSDAGTVPSLESGACVAFSLGPGRHVFLIDGQNVAIEVAPGDRRYVRITNTLAGPKVSASNALTFLRLVTGKREPLYASN